MAKKYQIIYLHLSDGRELAAPVKVFCKEGDKLFLHPQFEVSEPKFLPEGYSWSTLGEDFVSDKIQMDEENNE